MNETAWSRTRATFAWYHAAAGKERLSSAPTKLTVPQWRQINADAWSRQRIQLDSAVRDFAENIARRHRFATLITIARKPSNL